MKKLISLLLVAALLVFLCTTNPTTEEFAAWYADQTNLDNDGSAMDQAMAAFTEYLARSAERSDYLVCSVFSYDGHKTLGIGLMFFPIDSLSEQVDDLRSDYANWLKTYTK